MNSCSSSTILPSAGERVLLCPASSPSSVPGPARSAAPTLLALRRGPVGVLACGKAPASAPHTTAVTSACGLPPFTTHPSRTSCTLQPAVAAPALFFGQFAQPHSQLAGLRPPPPIPIRPTMNLDQPAGPLLGDRYLRAHHYHCPLSRCSSSLSSSRSGIGKLTRRSRVAKVEIPPQLRDLQAQWESPGPFRGAAFSTAFSPINCAIEFQF
jgi:hypothetical protein